ncbi:MAG TPA: iron ABC transporter permease [Stellaceae bacterium]|jgi:iron(III) transport system permease protein
MTVLADRIAESPAPQRRSEATVGVMVGLSVFASAVIAALLGVTLWLSFAEGTPGDYRLGYTFAHYREIFFAPFTYRVVGNTCVFSAIALAVALAFGLPLAWLIERTDFPGKRLVFTLLATALLVPGFSVALGWLFLLNPRIGLINLALEALLGLHAAPFNIASLLGMGIVEGLSLAPLAFVMTAIVFRSMDSSLEEAARIAGAGVWQSLRGVTVPLAWPGVLAASIYIFTIGFGTFDVPAILGLRARIFTFSTYVYMQISPSDGLPEYGGVATLSVFMLILALAFSAWYGRVQRQAPRYAVVTGKAYRPALIRLGGWRWSAIAFVALYLAVSQLLPILTLLWSAGLPFLRPVDAAAFASLSLKNFRDLPEGLVASGLGNTAMLMLLVPTITLVLSVALSWVVLRSRLRWRAAFDFFAFLPHAVPKIVFSVAAWLLALFVLRDALPIYGTIWILVPIYVVATLSYGTRMINGALIQIHRELEESAMVAGASLAGTLRAVLLPLLRPAILYSWIWIALLSYRELTIPVVLSTNDNQPLSIIVWSLVLSDSYGQGSAVAILMLLLMLPILLAYAAIARRAGIAPAR